MLFLFGVLVVLLSVPSMKTHILDRNYNNIRTLPVANPMLTAGYFQGDMRLTEAQKNRLTNDRSRMQRMVVDNLWPDKTVNYFIDPSFVQYQIDMIHEAMFHISSKSCVRFQKATGDKPYLFIQNFAPGCWADVGYTGNLHGQRLNLASDCFDKGLIIHELLHTVGFYHQHSASDRDSYVRIHWENIEPEERHNFNKYPPNVVNDFGVGYDYASIMHYAATDFSKNGKPSIEVLQKSVPQIGQRVGLSRKDILKLNTAYKC